MKRVIELALATACSKCQQLADVMPHWVGRLEKCGQVWDNSKLLNHPYVALKRGFVFIHVPKAAGSSINNALGLHAPLTIQHSHNRVRDVMPFLKRVSPNIISIAFVRNPYTRFISLYTHARADESLYHSAISPERAAHGKHVDYDILADKNLEECAELLVQGKLGLPGTFQAQWHPQVEWLTDQNRKLMVDFIGRFESLELDLERLHQTYGIAIEAIPWLNKSPSEKENAPQWTERARNLVRLYYKRDFEMLGYSEEMS